MPQPSDLPRITRTEQAVAPAPPEPEPEDGIALSAAKSIGRGALSGLQMLGNMLDLPVSMIRDVLVADNPLDQFLDPMSHQQTGRSATGRDVLSRNFLTSWLFSPNKETGMAGWASDPWEGVQDVAGFTAELALDPLSWLTGGVAKTPGMFGDLAHAIKTPAAAGKLAKIDKGLRIANELDPGTHVGRALGIPQALAKRSRLAQANKIWEATAGPERERVQQQWADAYRANGYENADDLAEQYTRVEAAFAHTWAGAEAGRTSEDHFRKLRVQASTAAEVGSDALNQSVFHGTPHSLEPEPGFPHGRIRLDKIGTGEGTLNHGWGWYSASTEKSGKFYKEYLSSRKAGAPSDAGNLLKLDVPDEDFARFMDLQKPVIEQPELIRPSLMKLIEDINASAQKIVDAGPSQKWLDQYGPGGSYEKWFAEKKPGVPYEPIKWKPTDAKFIDPATATGRDLQKFLTKEMKMTPKDVSMLFDSLGIPGARVADEIKLGITQTPAALQSGELVGQAENYVIWNQDVLDRTVLLEKNGQKLEAVKKDILYQSPSSSAPPIAPAFYSKIVSAIDDGKIPNRVDRSQFEKTLTGYGVKPEELADLKPRLDDLFAQSGGKVSRDSIRELVENDVLKQLEVTELSIDADNARFPKGTIVTARNIDSFGTSLLPRHSDRMVAGGVPDTAREFLFRHKSATPFGGGHYEDFPDTFAHARLDDVILPDGSKSLRINEIQSDLHQQAWQTRKTAMEDAAKAEGIKLYETSESLWSKISDDSSPKKTPEFEAWLNANKEKYPLRDFYGGGSSGNKYETLEEAKRVAIEEVTKEVEDRGWGQVVSNANDWKKITSDGMDFVSSEALGVSLHQDVNTGKWMIYDNDTVFEGVGHAWGYQKGGPPDAPFKETWHELALKQIIRKAAEEGYDSVSLVKGRDIAKVVGGPPDALGKFYDEKIANTLKKMVAKHGGKVSEATTKGVNDTKWIQRQNDAFGRNAWEAVLPDGTEASIFKEADGTFTAEYHTVNMHNDSYGGFDTFDEAKTWVQQNNLGPGRKTFTTFTIPPSLKQTVLEKGQPLYQGAKGAIEFGADNSAVIHILQTADASTGVHELGHFFQRQLPPELLKAASEAIGVADHANWSRENHEVFATMFEKYVADGSAPTSGLRDVFEKFKEWLTNIYASIAGSPLEQQMNSQLKEVFDSMLGAPKDTGPMTVADRAFKMLDSHAALAQAKAKAAGGAAYQSLPEGVRKWADVRATALGQLSEGFTRWIVAGFDSRVDDRMNEAGQIAARKMTEFFHQTYRKYSEPLVAVIGDVNSHGPGGLMPETAKLADGQTIGDWYDNFSQVLYHALETGDTKPLDDLLPGTDGNPGPFVAAYDKFQSLHSQMLSEAKAAGVEMAPLKDVIDYAFRQMNPRLAEWNRAREIAPGGAGTGTRTREDLFKGFYKGTGGKISAGVNAVTSNEAVLNAVRDAAKEKIIEQGGKKTVIPAGPETAGKNVAKIIESNPEFAGNVDPRMVQIDENGKFSMVDPSTATPGNTPKPFKMERKTLDDYYVRAPEKADREFSTAAGDKFDLAEGELFDLENNQLHREHVFKNRMPIVYEKMTVPEGDKFGESLSQTLQQQFDDRWEHLGRYLWGSDDAARVQLMHDHVNQVATNGGVFGGHILINQMKMNHAFANNVATAKHFTDVFEAGLRTGDVRIPEELNKENLTAFLSKQEARIDEHRKFLEKAHPDEERWYKQQIKDIEAETAAVTKRFKAGEKKVSSRAREKSHGVTFGQVFDHLNGIFNRKTIYRNSYDRLAKAYPDLFKKFMEDIDVPEGMEMDDFLEAVGGEIPQELNVEALTKFMDNLTMDQEMAHELLDMHKAFNQPVTTVDKMLQHLTSASSQWKAIILAMPSTQVRNFFSGAIANMYSNIWSATSHRAANDILFSRPSEILSDFPEIVAHVKKRGFDQSDPLSFTRAARELYAIEKGHLASEARDFVGQANADDMLTDMEHMLGLLPGHTNIRSWKNLRDEYFGTLLGRREASWKDPFEIAGTTQVMGKNRGRIRRESKFAPVAAINIPGKAADDVNRIEGWLEGMRQGKSSREAFKRSSQVQLDYDPRKFTGFEQKLKAIFPFYSFFSRETAYFANEIMTNPAGKLGKLIRLINASQTSDYLPEHVREGGAIPFGTSDDGTENYITGLGLMFEDVPKVMMSDTIDEFGRHILSRTNPLIKGPVEYALGRSSFQGGPLGGRDLADMDPVLGRIFTQLGIQKSLPNTNARPAFGSPALEHALANSPLSRILSTTKTLLDSPERKSVLDKALITLTGLRITSVSPEQRQRGIREVINARSKELGARAFTTMHISKAMLAEAEKNKESDPETYAEMLAIVEKRKELDAAQRIRRKERDIAAGTVVPTKKAARALQSRILRENGIKMPRAEREERITKAISVPEGTDAYMEWLIGIPLK